MPHHRPEWAGSHTFHAAPAAAHIDKWTLFFVEAHESATAAGFIRQAAPARVAKVVIDLEHNTASCTIGHLEASIVIYFTILL
jgi:hypothetical protein